MRTSTLKPGLLVALATRVDGGVNYKRVDLDQEHTTDDGSKMARWETTRTIEDPAEFDRATKLRGKCRSLITAVCSASDFGLLCPASREAELDAAMTEATRLADEFNRSAARSCVSVYVLKGRIAQDDAEAVRAIGSEVRGLLDQMERGIQAASPEAIRAGLRFVAETRALNWEQAGESAQRFRQQLFSTPDFAEGIRAFREKRQPRWPSRMKILG